MHRQHQNAAIFVSDCEGPISKNDNAFELSEYFIPDGGYFFSLISKYDDVLADVVKKPGYRAGYTLKLITPFLKAYGATNEAVMEYSSKNVLLVQGAREMLQYVRTLMPSFIVSTSYEQYISSLCSFTGFPYENVYCTALDLDKHRVSEEEVDELKALREEISSYPMIEIPEGAKSIHDLSVRGQETIVRLDEVFWKEIPKKVSGRILEEVKPMGGEKKAKAVLEIVKKLSSRLKNVMYVGDSITDVQAFWLVKEGGGLTVSFNGNSYAVRGAEVAVLSENAIVTSILADLFFRFGKGYVMRVADEWSPSALERYSVDESLRKALNLFPDAFPKVELINPENINRLVKESSVFRRNIRGEAIGKLG